MTRFVHLQTMSLAFAISVLIAWTAWDRGGAYYSTQLFAVITLLALGVLAVCSFWKTRSYQGGAFVEELRDKPDFMPPPFIAVVSLVIWGIAFSQSSTMPSAITTSIAPGVASIYSDWISVGVREETQALQDSEGAMRKDVKVGVPLSVAPTYTRLALLMPATFAVVCWLLFYCFRNVYAIVIFLASVSLLGVLFSFFGLVDAIRLAGEQPLELRQFLVISPAGAGDPFGPFVNNNNAAGFLCLSLACALGMWVLCECLFEGRGIESRGSRARNQSGLILMRVVALMVIVLIFAGVLGSNSRGGFIGLVLGTSVVLVSFLRRMKKVKVVLISAAGFFLLCVVVSAIGFGERVRSRLATLFEKDLLEDPRLDHWADALVAAQYYFPAGAGLGTYRYAHLPFQASSIPYWFVNADGMPVEWLVEGGGWLLPLVALILIVLLRRVWRLGTSLRDTSSMPFNSAAILRCVWVVALFAIPSLVTTQLFDFGVTLLPLLMVFAGVCAAILRASDLAARWTVRADESGKERRRFRVGWLVRLVAHGRHMSGFLFAGWFGFASLMLVVDLYVASSVEEETMALYQERKGGSGKRVSLHARLAKLEQLSWRYPGNSMVWKGLAEMRLAEQERLGELDLQQLDKNPSELHKKWVARENVRQATHSKTNDLAFQQLLLPQQDSSQWVLARRDLLRALLLSPLDDNVRVSLIELDMVTPEANLASGELLTQAAALRPQNKKFIQYLLWLAHGHPGDKAASEIQKRRIYTQTDE